MKEIRETVSPTVTVAPGQTAALALSGVIVAALLTWSALSLLYHPAEVARDTPVPDNDSTESPFAEIALEAKAAFVWDIREQRPLFALNAEIQLPLASLTKLMTALIVYETLDRDGVIEVRREAIAQEGDSGFSIGERFYTKDLLDFTLLESSNDGAHALATASARALNKQLASTQQLSFAAIMNQRAEELGLAQTYFLNSTGLDASESASGSYGSAKDIAFLMEHLLTRAPEAIAATRYASLIIPNSTRATYRAVNTNRIVSTTPGVIGSKTGFTALAGGNIAMAVDGGINHPLVIVVLGSTEEGRFRDAEKLAAGSFEALQYPRTIEEYDY